MASIIETIFGEVVQIGTALTNKDMAEALAEANATVAAENEYTRSQYDVLSEFEKSQNMQTIVLEVGIGIAAVVGMWLIFRKKKKKK
jgi:hypothetical protein